MTKGRHLEAKLHRRKQYQAVSYTDYLKVEQIT